MTIERGRPWGSPGPLPPDGVVVRSDAEARAVVTAARRAGEPIPTLGLLGGDLCRTLGGRGDAGRLRSDDAVTFPVDLGSVLLDGRIYWFVAHVIARRRLWSGRFVVVMNAQWLEEWDLGPRAHPDDGLLDITDGSLPWAQRLEARRRARTGTHLPHPALRVERTGAWSTTFDRPTPVYLDGERIGDGTNLAVRVEPDALTVVV